MKFDKKLYILSGITAALAVLYALTFVFDAARADARKARYTWLNAKYTPEAASITVRGAEDGEVHLEKTEGAWQVVVDDKRYPAKESFVAELFTALSTPGAYPIRSKTDAAHRKLGVDEESAKRLQIKTAAGSPLIDLLIGGEDTTGKRYMRKNGSPETRAGADNLRGFGTYLSNYYDLRLFPGQMTVGSVQRIRVSPPQSEDGSTPAAWTLARQNNGWHVEGKDDTLNTVKVEQYVRSILDAAAEDFLTGMNAEDEPFIAQGTVPGRLVIETGSGGEEQITLGPKSGDRRAAAIRGRSFVYGLSDWTANQLFKSYDTLKE